MQGVRFPLLLLLGVFLLGQSACKRDSPAPSQEPPKEAPKTTPSASAASAEQKGPKAIPTLVLEEFAPAGGKKPEAVFSVQGATVVTSRQSVGRIVGDTVEWLKEKIPAELPGSETSQIDAVEGVWPDSIDVLFSSESTRAPVPSYMPLTGKGQPISFAMGGGPAGYVHLARLGDSVMLSGWSYTEGILLTGVRGPKLVRKQQTPKEAGCKPGEVELGEWFTYKPAIWSTSLAASRSGVLAAVGSLCEKRGPALEVWENAETSKIVDLTPQVKDIGYWPQLLGGKEEIWLYSGKHNPIIQYKSGEVKALPKLEGPPSHAFVSAGGVLHVVAGSTLMKLEDERWVEIGRFSWPMMFRTVVVDGDSMWASGAGVVYRIREGKGLSFDEGCKTPFVYLYDVNPGNANKFTFPSTRKALATFPAVADIELQEINEGTRRLGVKVKSKEQAEALITHLSVTMKDENPSLLCYAAKKPRVIAINGGK